MNSSRWDGDWDWGNIILFLGIVVFIAAVSYSLYQRFIAPRPTPTGISADGRTIDLYAIPPERRIIDPDKLPPYIDAHHLPNVPMPPPETAEQERLRQQAIAPYNQPMPASPDAQVWTPLSNQRQVINPPQPSNPPSADHLGDPLSAPSNPPDYNQLIH